MAAQKIFIGYRRGVDNDSAGRVFDRLAAAFGDACLFRDVDRSRDMAGLDFTEVLDRNLKECCAFVAVIGPGWIEAIPRLFDESDFVRLELESALAREGLRVIPVMVNDTQLPEADALPPSLRKLVRRGALWLRNEGYSQSIRELTDVLATVMQDAQTAAAPRAGTEPSPAASPAAGPAAGPAATTDPGAAVKARPVIPRAKRPPISLTSLGPARASTAPAPDQGGGLWNRVGRSLFGGAAAPVPAAATAATAPDGHDFGESGICRRCGHSRQAVEAFGWRCEPPASEEAAAPTATDPALRTLHGHVFDERGICTRCGQSRRAVERFGWQCDG